MRGRLCFDCFSLDLADRALWRRDERVELNSRYFDALALLVQEGGHLVSKDRFLSEVWKGVPVTDEALTQCIRSLRRQLGDDAGRPRFIETVPKHGYRFVAPVAERTSERPPMPAALGKVPDLASVGLGGTFGGGLAGLIGGTIYGFGAAFETAPAPVGAVSILLVLLFVTALIGLLGAAGVAFGIAFSSRFTSPRWIIAGGALGGLVVGGLVKLLGIDALTLLFGAAPRDMTGPFEGTLLGGAAGLAVWLSVTFPNIGGLRRAVAAGAIAGAAAGLVIFATGGRLMGGSLALLQHAFPRSEVRLDRLGALVGEADFGATARLITSVCEGALFVSFVVGGMVIAKRVADGSSLPANDRKTAVKQHGTARID